MREQATIPAPWNVAAEYAEHEPTGIATVRETLTEPPPTDRVRVEEEGGGEAKVIVHLFPGDEGRELESGLL